MTPNGGAAERWRETWDLVGAPPPEGLLEPLLDRYSQPHRAYHTLEHVRACLALAAEVRPRLEHPGCVELALWFHDAVYDPRAGDNEERSAELAAEALGPATSEETREHVRRLVLATRHPSRPAESDARYLVDLDLAVLGAAPEAFDAYEAAIRREYRWVPLPLYRVRRRQVLQGFLDLDRIYLTDELSRRWEMRARANLERSLARP